VESLGSVFYTLLHDPNSKQPRLFSFSVIGQIPADLAEALTLGVRYRFFLSPTSQGSKSGGGQDPLYILNRRLCPAYKLDPSAFTGRLTLSAEMLKVACEDPKRFVRLRLKEEADPGKTLVDMTGDDEEEPPAYTRNLGSRNWILPSLLLNLSSTGSTLLKALALSRPGCSGAGQIAAQA
jgi:hypothetical protein